MLEENPIGHAIMAFMQNKERWEGTPSKLLEKLENEDFVKEHKIDVKADKWPGSFTWVTRRIKEIEANLEHEGVKFETKREKDRRIIILTERDDSKNGSDSISRPKEQTGQQELIINRTTKGENLQNSVNLVGTSLEKVNVRNAVTCEMLSPPMGSYRSTKLTIGELLPILCKEWPSGYEADLIGLTVKRGSWTEKEAKQLIKKQVKEGHILRDPEGFWKWMH